MTKSLLLSLVHNVSTQLSNEIVALNDDILFLQNELSVSKTNNCSDHVKKKTERSKEQNLKQLSAFLTKYVMFLLDKRKSNVPYGSYYSDVMSRNGGIANLIEGIGKADLSKEDSASERLKYLCQKRSALQDMLRLLQISEVEKLSDDKSQDLFSDLMFQLRNSILGGGEHLFNGIQNIEEGAMFPSGKTSDNDSGNSDDENGNDDGNASSGDRSSTVASLGLGIKFSCEQVSDLDETSMPSACTSNAPMRRENFAKSSSLNRHMSEKGSPLNWKSLTEERVLSKSSSLTSPFFKKQEKCRSINNRGNSSAQKFNSMRKCFSNTGGVTTSFPVNRDRKMKEGAVDIPTRSTTNGKSKISILRKSSREEPAHLENKHTDVEVLKEHIEKGSPNISVKPIPPSINKTCKNVYTRKGRNRSNGVSWEERDQSGSFDSLSSSSSDASAWRGPGGEKTQLSNQMGRKKYLIRINKKGHGSFEVKKKGAKSCARVYDFEIIYEGVDGVVGSMDATSSEQRTRKQLVHFSFLRRGGKICGVEKLHIGDIDLVRSLHFGRTTKGEPRDDHVDCESGGNELVPRRRRERTKKEANKRINFLEENLKNMREENFRKKYELTRIIDDIKKKKMKNIVRNDELNYDVEAESYNMEFVETNRLRGLYIHMLDKQSQLERDRNFYKNELEKLQQDMKNNAAPLADFLKEEKEKFIQREKEFYKKEKKYFQVKSKLRKKVTLLENELEIAQEKLKKEREENKNLKSTVTEKLSIIEKKDSERRNSEQENESKIRNLNTELQELMETFVVEKEEKNKLQEEISLIRKDVAFDNFKKVVLEKITKTNGDIKYLAEILELLTKELENKISKESLNDKHVRELKEECAKKTELLSNAEDKIKKDKSKMRKLKEDIAYLHEKNRNLLESVRCMVAQGVGRFPNHNEVVTADGGTTYREEEGYYSSDERGGRMLVYSPRETSQIAQSNDIPRRNRKGTKGCRPRSGKRPFRENKESITSVSDNSSLFLCHDMDTKRGYSSDELTSGAVDSAYVCRGLIRHSLK
ncbi:conserved Plasmodium protein, unknown function [Plasmodium knowlesi strain H]|uniref:Uncharacterized protein n=3 Tax=Plasmodium knowlesi TaxID=5850 RepID=A0A5K1UG60_PLAKH|nr:conserved Plasmodium protein, unknown function [Plasmodium knowlesi strain H]OTN67562.1 Uncharacterized protein PKNOH_S06413500 [Plasmodium knowlesi]CAA9987411.1 conserved Plasmodium protein, unknown function [Plasmodium knowlesi strain H]SBO23287.1 conserved Plasmodium protein, unknown function [Plasmodium knowlesi strain H]SBO24320.1 conserved Plasmodium protein, unknown function [Plasmodium knowlesi strain H]VVS76885.1 conserved Plasmodium protein, unknown function [Plasmodium knowlesi s|eukprot:XP_002258412.1 hypothetical protein, conserved in Plasmodium species [Plasmodium knowlesi strain H]